MANITVTCGDCIHADICKQLNGGWFSCKNIAYCKWFKDRTKFVEVVRCNKCTYWEKATVNKKGFLICPASGMEITADDFCSYGERKDDV